MEETAEKSILFVLNSISADNCHGYGLIANSPDNATRDSPQLSSGNLKTSLDYPVSLLTDRMSIDERFDNGAVQNCLLDADLRSLDRSSDGSSVASDERSLSTTLAGVCHSSSHKNAQPFERSFAEAKVTRTLITLTVSPLVNSSSSAEGGTANLKSSANEKQSIKAFGKLYQAKGIHYVADNVFCERGEHNIYVGNDDQVGNQRASCRSIKQAANNQTNRSLSTSQRYYLISQASKQSHNEKERRRRSRMRKSCEMLRGLVPGVNEKTDKARVLEVAVEYIQQLQEYLGQKQGETEQISKQIS